MIIVICGPSGSGKSTLSNGLYKAIKGAKPLPSYTTRPRRASDAEHEGELTFINEGKFFAMRHSGEFIWTARPYKISQYGTRVSDVSAALQHGTSIALLTGDAPAILYGYALARGELAKIVFFYLYIDNEVELQRRLEKDVSRIDTKERLAAVATENRFYMQSSIPFHKIDVTQSEAWVLQTVLAILDKLSPNP